MVLYPLSLIYLLFPLPWSLGIFCLAHLFLGGMGMFLLARRWTGQPFAAAVAGVAFAFNGLSLSCLIWPNNIAALGWMPWVVYLVERSWREGGRTILLAGWCAAVQMLAGAPEFFLFTWIILGGLCVAELKNCGIHRGRLILRTAGAPLLIIGLVSVQLFPFLELLRQSQRDANFGGFEWAMPPWGWANFLLPLFRCEPTEAGVYLQTGQVWASSYYLGIFVVALALCAPWYVRTARVAALSFLLGFSLVMALGEGGHLYQILRRFIPLLGFLRFPVKWVVPAAFIVPLLAGFSIAHFCSGERREKAASAKAPGVLCVLSGVALILFLLWFERTYPNQPETDWPVLLWNGLLRIAFLTVLFIIFYFSVRRPFRASLSLLLLLGVWLDVLMHTPRQNPGVNPQVYRLDLPTSREMNSRPRVGESRAMLSEAAIRKFHSTMLPSTFDYMLGMRMGLYDNLNLLQNIPKVDGFYSLYLPHEQDVRRLFFSGTNRASAALADLLNVSQVTAPSSYFDWEPRPNWMPLITGGQKPAFFEREETLQSLVRPDFDGRKILYLTPSLRSEVKASERSEVQITSREVSAHHLGFQVRADRDAMILVSQTYYPNWHANVDGKPVPVWRADHSLQALQVGAGTHEVSLFYRDHGFLWGTVVTIGTLIVSVSMWFLVPAVSGRRWLKFEVQRTPVHV
jgi:hypothetical protein